MERVVTPARPDVARNGGSSSISVPAFGSVEGFMDAMGMRKRHEYVDLYPRDGTKEIEKLESEIAELIGIESRHVLVFSNGMSAINTLVEAASPALGTVVLHANDEYSRTRVYLGDQLPLRGVKSVRVDTLSTENIRNALRRHRPNIIVLETVANGPNVPVIDIDALFSMDALRQSCPLIILDNTLPTPTLVPPERLLRRGFRVAVIESGMKAFSDNVEMVGIVYTHDNELRSELWERRISLGSMPSFYQARRLAQVVGAHSKAEFDEKNRRMCCNTLEIARACHDAEGDGSVFVVSHPNLSTHPNSGIANRLYPDGATPVFFIQCTGIGQAALAKTLMDSEFINRNCKLGQSFGFEDTRIFPDGVAPTVRIAGGHNVADVEREAAAFRDALLMLRS